MASKGLKLTKSRSVPTVPVRDRTPVSDEKDDAEANAAGSSVKPKVVLKPSSFGKIRQCSTINISADKWLLTMDEESIAKLESPPSLADGLDLETEKDLRYLGCEVIQSGAILLNLPQVAAATAQILYQRYFYQRSFIRHNWEYIAMGCLLLASKIEEAPRRPRDVINVFHRLEYLHGKRTESKEYVPMMLDSKYVNLKNQVIKAERKLLNVLGFVVHVNHPHKLICAYLNALLHIENKELLQRAWNYMNDGLRTDIFLRYRPETIACACIFLAARTISKPVVIPEVPFPWYEAFDASDRDVRTICLILLKVYRRVRAPNWTRLNDALNKIRGIPPEQPESRDVNPNTRTSAVSAELERKRKEIAAKADEMRKQHNGAVNARKDLHEDTESEQSSEGSRSRSPSESSSVSSADSRRVREASYDGRRQVNSENRSSQERPGRRRHKHHHRDHRKRDRNVRQDYRGRGRRRSHPRNSRSQSREGRQKIRAREERLVNNGRDDGRKSNSIERRKRSRSKERRQRQRSNERRRILKDRVSSNQRERERDVYKVLGKHPRSSESPERPSKQRR